MRHRVNKHSFGRKYGPRVALMRGLVNSLVEHGRIRTTLPKAKELRRYVEKAITKGKDGTVHARRTLLSKYPNPMTVKTIVDDLSVRFKDRPGGYTRILKAGPRPGDQAEMAYIEFVDYVLPEPKDDVQDKEVVKKAKAHARAVARAKKSRRKMQSRSRQVNQAKARAK